jgi:hypothetical protein
MIKISDERRRILQLMFRGVSDRDLIHELVRRERLLQLQHNVAFWPEMRHSGEGYMDAIREQSVRGLGRALADHPRKPIFTREILPPPDCELTKAAIYSTDVVTLVSA